MATDGEPPLLPDSLNEAQRRAVTVRLRALERLVADAERWLAADQAGLLLRDETRVSSLERQAFQTLFESIRAELARVIATFDLEPEATNGLRRIRAEAAELWADLVDAQPAKLRRYGPVDSEMVATLGPHIARLIELTSTLYALADRALAADVATPPDVD